LSCGWGKEKGNAVAFPLQNFSLALTQMI